MSKKMAQERHSANLLGQQVTITQHIKASTFENLIHKLFDAVQLQVNAGIAKPKEWYIVPFPVIDQAVHYIIEGKPVSSAR